MAEKTTVPEIKEAVAVIRKLSADEKVQEEAFQREQTLHLEASLIGAAEKRGIEIGEKRGIEIGEKRGIEIGVKAGKIIFSMINEGKDNTEIISELISKFNISEESASEFLEQYR